MSDARRWQRLVGFFIAFTLAVMSPCLVALFIGAWTRGWWGHLVGLAWAVAVGSGFAVVAINTPRFGEHTRLVGGAVLAGLALGVVPQLICHWIGYLIGTGSGDARSLRWSRVLWALVVLTVLLVPVALVVAVISYTLVACDPGQYDCPFG